MTDSVPLVVTSKSLGIAAIAAVTGIVLQLDVHRRTMRGDEAEAAAQSRYQIGQKGKII